MRCLAGKAGRITEAKGMEKTPRFVCLGLKSHKQVHILSEGG